MARGLKFRIYEEEGLYYLCSENKGADQPCGYREADLRHQVVFAYAKSRFSQDAAHMLWMEFEHKSPSMFGLKCEHGATEDPFAKRFINLLFSTLIFNSLIIN